MTLQVGTRGNPSAKILIVGESYGAEEERVGQPFVGMSGKELDRMLMEAGINPNDCYYTNVVNKRPYNNEMHRFFFDNDAAKRHKIPDTRGLYPDIPVLEGIRRLEDLIEQLQPKIIIGFGNYTLWALTQNDFRVRPGGSQAKGYKVPTGITDYRGSMLRTRVHGIPFLPTYHPAAVLRQWPWRYQAVHDLRARVRKALAGEWDEPPMNFLIRPSFEEAMSAMQNLVSRAALSNKPLMVTCDIETQERFIECIGFGWGRNAAACIPLMFHGNREGYWSPMEEVEIMLMVKKVLEHPNIIIVGQNFLYDYQYFWYYYNTRPNYQQDTMLAHHLCFPGTPMGLNYISSLYCSYHRYWKDDGKEAAKQHNDEERWVYNCRDCVITYEAIEELWKIIKYYKLEKQFAIQMTRTRAAIKMMLRGTAVDEARRGEELLTHMETAQVMENQLEAYLPSSVFPRQPKKAAWYRSSQQQIELFYNVLGVAEVSNRKTGNMTVDDEALRKIGGREPLVSPITNLLQQYRSLETFAQFLTMKVGQDKRMRATFSPTTETFRYRSSADVFGYGRNLQNLPSGTEDE